MKGYVVERVLQVIDHLVDMDMLDLLH